MATVNVKSDDGDTRPQFKYDDIDLSDVSDEELMALGIDPTEVRDPNEEPEDEEEDEENIEEEGEDEEEDKEEDQEEDQEEPEETKEEEPKIPKSRFDDAVWKERERAIKAEAKAEAIQERLDELIALQQQISSKESEAEPAFNFEEAEEQYADLLLEGETKQAATLRNKINSEKDKWIKNLVKEVRSEALKEATDTSKKLSEKEKINAVVAASIVEYPVLDDESEEYDGDLVNEVNALAKNYVEKKGLTGAEALQKAIDRLVKPTVKKETNTRKSESGKKKADTMRKQPPNTKTATKLKDKSPEDFDWESMSQKEFRLLYKKHPGLVKEALKKNYAV